MKLNPQQAPLYGECVLTVQLDDEDVCHPDEEEEEEGAEFYLLFSGSTQRHVSSTLRVSQVTLQAVCPAHNVCEQVLVTLCMARRGGPVGAHSQETFCFVQDLALDMAQFLLDSTDPQEALMLEEQQIPLKECEKLDQSVALALKHLSPPPHRTTPGGASTQTHTDVDTHIQDQTEADTDEARVQQLSTLLHLAARHGLRAVATFVLQQPRGQEALRRLNTRGETAAQEAGRRGHEKLLELFKLYETPSNVKEEPKERVPSPPDGRIFQHHASLGTYTLTCPTLHQREEGPNSEGRDHPQEVEELRRLIHLHRDTKVTSAECGHRADGGLFYPAFGLQASTNGQPESGQDAGRAAVTIETCGTTTDEQGSLLSLEERTQGAELSTVTQTSCSGGSVCQTQEGEVRGSSAAGRSRKNKKRAGKSKKITPEDEKRDTKKNTGGKTKKDSTISPTKPSEPTVIIDSGDSKSSEAGGTPLPIKPEGKFAESHALAVQTTVIVEKQEAEKWEVEQGQTHTWTVSSEPRPAEETTETMGQEQSQDPQESQSEPEGPSSPNAMSPSPKSPNSERKPRRALWSRMGSALSNEEGEAKTVWYESEDMQQVNRTDRREKDVESQSVWYDAELPEQRADEQLEQSKNKAGSPEQLLEQSPGPQQPCAAGPHAAGSPPAPSHDPAAQRQEVHASQREEEAGPECGRESETGRDRKISETAEEEKDTKSKRKRRKKKGRRGGAEDKLSSSSSIESSGLGESQRGPETDLNIEERGQTGRADIQAASGTTTREEAEQDAMTLPGQTDGRSRSTHGPDFEVSYSDPPEVSVTGERRTEPTGGAPLQTLQTWDENVSCGHESLNLRSSDAAEIRATDVEGNITVQQDRQEVLDRTELGLGGHDGEDQQTEEKVEIKAENQDFTVQTSKEQNDPLFDVEFPGLKTQHVLPMDLNREGRPVDPEGQPVGFMDPERPVETGGLPCGVTADVSPLLTVGGRAASAPGEYSEHCLASEMLRDQQQEEEEKKETWVGEEEVGKDRGGREESDIRMVRGAEESTLERDAEQKYNEELAAAAVAVVTVAVASAMASVELSQQLGNSHAQSDETAGQDGLALQTDSLKQPDDDVQPQQVMSSELPAAAVAVVTVAVASAMASIELSQQIANNQAQDSQTETELQVDADAPTLKQHALDENQTQEAPNCPSMFGSRPGKAEDIQGDNVRPLLEAKEAIITKGQRETQLHEDAASPSFEQIDRAENQPQEAPNHPFMLCPQPVEVDGKPQTKKEPLLDVKDESTPEVELRVETDAPILKELVIEENPTEGTQMGLFTTCSQPVEGDSIAQDNLKPSPEAKNEATVMVEIQPHVDVDSSEQLMVENTTQGTQKDLLSSCLQPVEVDSEPRYDSSAKAKAIDVVEGQIEKQPLVDEIDSSLQLVKDGNQVQEPQNSLLTPCFKAVDSKQQDNLRPSPEPPAKVDTPDVPIPKQSFMEGDDLVMACSQAGEVDGMLQPKQTPLPEGKDEIIGKVNDEKDVRVLFLDVSESGVQYEEDSPPFPELSPPEAAPPETGELRAQQSRPLSDITLDVDLKVKDYVDAADFNQLDVNSDSVDVLDGWKERERARKDREKELRRDEDTSLREAERLDWSRREDSTLTLQIQRDRDVFCPVQPLPEPSTLTCTDVLPEADECVSLCLTRTDKDGLMVGPGLDDNVFKKPADPPPRLGHRDRGVCVSWPPTDEACLGERPLSVDPADPVAPRSSRLSWKSETEDRGGGEPEGGGGGGGGEEEEKQDQLTENPVSSAIMRATIRSLSPLRRHSWEPPGKNATITQGDVTSSSPLKSQSGDTKKPKTPLHRRSMSWCPSNLHHPDPVQQHIDNRSYSLEGLEERVHPQTPRPSILSDQQERSTGRREERGSLLSLTEEEQEGDASSIHSQSSHPALTVTNSCPPMFHHQTLTKSISMVAISHRDISVIGYSSSKRRISFSLSIPTLLPKNRRFFTIGCSSSDEEEEEGGRSGSFSSNTGSLEYSISEEEPGPLRSDTEGKGGPKISRTFSYLRNKMTKKGKEKEKEKRGERERESKEKEKKSINSHVFVMFVPSPSSVCQICCKPLNNKDTFTCNNCGVNVHKYCRESVPVCSKSKTKLQTPGPEAAPGSAANMRSKSTSSASSISSSSSSSSRERWSTVATPDDQLPVVFPRRPPSIFNTHSNLSKSISTSNIAGLDEVPLKGLKFLSQSTDSLHKGSKVNASTESLTDEGTEMMDSQLMGEFECDVKDLEADSWSGTVDKKFLKTLKKDEIKRQDVIYELYQTEFHHVRTLRIMTEVYYKGLQKELQLDMVILEKIFPVVEELLDMHSLFFSQLLERKRASSSEGHSNNFLICSVGDVLCQQFSGCCADRMKKIYGKFCSRHNEAVNLYKDLYAKDKRFQAFIKRTMSSSIVRRLGIPECILLVTQRITKYPVLIQRILQHTKESDEDHSRVCEALRCVKELIAAVDSKVNEQEKKQRLREVYSRTDSKSIMRMKSGQMFAKEDLIRGRKLLHDGALQLKNSAGRLKEVQALLLSDVLVFLQEKDTKYVFASLDQRSTVISLQNLIVREVANEERGLFLITAGIERPEMVEVLASSKEERNTWRAIIQDAMHCMEKDEDEGVPSETEEDRRQQESRAKEIRELLRQKDEQIVSLLEEKVHIFRDLGNCSPAHDDRTPTARERMLFRATADEVTKGEPIIKDALREVEALHALVHSGVAGAGCSTPVGPTGGSVGPVCLPRRAETFGGFDSHQMNSSKNGEKEEGDESLDLRRTESDSVLKKGATASLQILLKRNNEQVQHSVTHLHDLLLSLQAVVVQQDSFIEDQRQALSDRLTANSSRHSSSSSLSSSSSSRPSSLIEQEKHRSLERQRQEAASLQKQQAAHQEEKKRREKAWELKERSLAEREERLRAEEEETSRRRQELMEERDTLQKKKEEYQRELERLREAQRRLERDKEALRRDTERLEAMRRDEPEQLQRYRRTPSTTSEDSIRFHSSGSLDMDSKEAEETKEVELSSSAPTKEPFLRIGSKRMGKNFNPFSSSSSKAQGAEKESQPSKLLQLTKPKEKKDKKKKKSKDTENKMSSDPQNDGDIFFC